MQMIAPLEPNIHSLLRHFSVGMIGDLKNNSCILKNFCSVLSSFFTIVCIYIIVHASARTSVHYSRLLIISTVVTNVSSSFCNNNVSDTSHLLWYTLPLSIRSSAAFPLALRVSMAAAHSLTWLSNDLLCFETCAPSDIVFPTIRQAGSLH